MLKAKVKQKLPALKFIGEIKRKSIDELFEPVKTLIFEDDEEENEAERVICENEWPGKHGKRFRRIFIENQKIFRKFTNDYKNTLNEVKSEMGLFPRKQAKPILSETLDDLRQVINNSKRKHMEEVPSVKIKDPIEIADYINEDESDEEEEVEDSTTWILLRTKCDEQNNEVISDGCMNFQEEEDDLMIRPSVDWEVLNKSYVKCQNWLNMK